VNAPSILLSVWLASGISGSVVGTDGDPLPGVTISVDGARRATTDSRGAFGPIELAERGHELLVTLDGFEPLAIDLTSVSPVRMPLLLELHPAFAEAVTVRSARPTCCDCGATTTTWWFDPIELAAEAHTEDTPNAPPSGTWLLRDGETSVSLTLARSRQSRVAYDLYFALSRGHEYSSTFHRRARFDGLRLRMDYAVRDWQGVYYQTLHVEHSAGRLVLVPDPRLREFQECSNDACRADSRHFRLLSHDSSLVTGGDRQPAATSLP
jgi:hypothetical protein